MPIEVKAPVFPESIAEGTIMTWFKKPGEAVGPDEKLAEIETDKVVLEVAAASAGMLESVVKNVGDAVLSGEVIGYLGDGDGSTPGPATPPAKAPDATAPPRPDPASKPTPPPPHVHDLEVEPEPETPPGISPAARKLVKEHDLNVDQIKGSGRQGRITKADVLDHLTAAREGTAPAEVMAAPPPSPAATPAATPEPTPAPLPPPADAAPAPVESGVPAAAPVAAPAPASPAPGRIDERVPMSRIRRRIAERLVEAQQTAAILTTFNEVNMKPVMDLRAKYKEAFEKRHGVRLGFMSFFLKAAIEGLRRFPSVNASVDDADIVYHRYYDIGIAVSGPRGLLVPIVRDADRLAFHDIESTIRDFGARAKENRLGIGELQGGTFTISNGGVFGSLLSTPILNPPQSAILGMHAINERPVVENGEIVIRPVMYLALSYDHRIIDGREAVQFLVVIKDLLEDPSRLLLQV